jgi:hypothetical protein
VGAASARGTVEWRGSMATPIETLLANRGLSTKAEVTAFDAALVELSRLGVSAADLDELLLVLIDDTDDHEVMFGLVHLIEDSSPEAELAALFRVLPALADQAPEWVMTLHYRLLNDATSRSLYPHLLADASSAALEAARDILEVIAEDTDPSLRTHARHLLATLPP